MLSWRLRPMPPIKVYFKEGGPFAFVETTEEAAKLMKSGFNVAPELPVAGKTGLDEPLAMRSFWGAINKNAKNFLSHLLRYPDGVRGDKFSEEIAISVDKFGGVIGGASKMAKRFGLRFD